MMRTRSALSRHAFANAGIDVPLIFIPGNYVADGLLRLLASNGFDFDLPTYVVWEGNTMYLTRPAVLEVLTDLRKQVGEFVISFDYVTEAVTVYATGDERTSSFVRRFAGHGCALVFWWR